MVSLLKYIPLALSPDAWKNAVNDIRLVSALMRDPRVPMQAKAVPSLATVYLLSPLDLIPAWIPVLGQLDDLAVMLMAVRTFKSMVPPAVMAEYEAKLGIAPATVIHEM
jgi:uncharacterized membrane protein YkvA (DUF1232 family)